MITLGRAAYQDNPRNTEFYELSTDNKNDIPGGMENIPKGVGRCLSLIHI